MTNNGPDNAKGVHVMDLLPKGLKFVSANGKYNSTTGIWAIGDLENGETAVLHIIAQVISSSVNITNTATVNQTNYDPNDTNDQSSTIITVGKDPNKNNSGTGSVVMTPVKTREIQLMLKQLPCMIPVCQLACY